MFCIGEGSRVKAQRMDDHQEKCLENKSLTGEQSILSSSCWTVWNDQQHETTKEEEEEKEKEKEEGEEEEEERTRKKNRPESQGKESKWRLMAIIMKMMTILLILSAHPWLKQTSRLISRNRQERRGVKRRKREKEEQQRQEAKKHKQTRKREEKRENNRDEPED